VNQMKELETKKIIAEEILNRMNDQGAADVLRDILSNNDNKIDWDKAFESIQKHMPELKMF
jgi:hypothetical protein